jgi:hypothetical protein
LRPLIRFRTTCAPTADALLELQAFTAGNPYIGLGTLDTIYALHER